MALFESYERREPQILAVLKEYGISSIEECKEITDAAGIDEKELCSMVRQANRTVVEPKDVLSDNVYHFDKDTRELSKVSDDRERDSIVAEAR